MKDFKNKNTLYILIGALVIIGVIILVVVLKKKQSSGASGTSGTTQPQCPNGEYTQEMYNKDLANLKTTCNKKLLIPVLGLGYWNDCMRVGKANLKTVGSCL